MGTFSSCHSPTEEAGSLSEEHLHAQDKRLPGCNSAVPRANESIVTDATCAILQPVNGDFFQHAKMTPAVTTTKGTEGSIPVLEECKTSSPHNTHKAVEKP